MRKLIVIGAAALLLAGCATGPTATLTAQDVHQRMDNTTALQLTSCQLDLVRSEKPNPDADVYIASVLKQSTYKHPAPVIMWEDGYGQNGCEMFHPDFEGEE